jgi:hypothetical protein
VNVDLFHCPRHGIKARCKNDRIERVVGIGRTQPGGRDFFDRRASDIYQCNVVAIVRLIVVGIENEPLGADWMIIGAQQLRRLGVLDRSTDLPAHVL